MREELLQVLTDARTNLDIRAVVLTGNGKGFCTGADLSRPRQRSRPVRARRARCCARGRSG